MLFFSLLLRTFVLEFPESVETKTIKNRIDHFNVSYTDTFDQRYYEDLQFIPSDGFSVALIYFGGEGTLSSSCIVNGGIVDLAKKINAGLFALEHRFFGKSQPFEDLETDHLKYLSIDQAMADLASFIDSIVLNHQSASKSQEVRVGVVGGSYPGALSSWFRLKYPQFAYASWASSAPVLIKNNFTEYDDYVASQLQIYSDTCMKNTQQALALAENVLDTDIEKFRSDFGFEADEQPTDMLYAMTDMIAAMVQYNSSIGLINTHCQLQEKEPSYDNLVTIVKKVCESMGSVVNADLRKQKNTSLASPYANGRSWSYMTCKEVGWFQTAAGRHRSSRINLDYFAGLCQDLFGIESLANETEKNRYFGGNNPAQTKIFFLNGGVDPWSEMSVHAQNEGLLRMSLIIENQSHCSDLNSISDNDPEPLRKAKEAVQLQMEEWLTEFNCNGTCVNGRCSVNGCICEENWAGKLCDVEVRPKVQLDTAIICSISIPVLLAVIIIFTIWIYYFKYLPKKNGNLNNQLLLNTNK